jgi:hemerythrin-like domain-containing protein
MPASSRTRDAIAVLKQDHKKVRQLLKKLESAEDGGHRLELLSEVENEVKVHTQIEEEIFYPAFQRSAQGEEEEHLYYEALEEHHVVDMVLPEIKNTDEESDEFGAKAKVLKDLIEHHAEEEETEMFPKARKLMEAGELKEIGLRLQRRRQQLMGSVSNGRRKRAA